MGPSRRIRTARSPWPGTDERHRGLLVVEAVSDRCGYAVTARQGKWVFAEWWAGGVARPAMDTDDLD